VAAALSEQAWAEIICTASGGAPDAEARAALATVLFEEYPAFAYDPKRWAAAYRRAGQMLKHLDAFAELYRQTWLPQLPDDQFEAVITRPAAVLTADLKTEAGFFFIRKLRERAEAVWLGAQVIRQANARHANVQREWLYYRLCDIWLDHFNSPALTYTRPSRGGPPTGPLIDFMRAAMRQIMPENKLPKPEAMRDAIDRERRNREYAKQLWLDLRATGGLTLKK
jgi:hypothetical protein